jgi:hypothetical protein
MPFLDKLHDLFVRTHLYPLVLLMLPAAQDDHDAAWIAARDTILLHDPQSEAEFRLACRLAVFSIQATHAAAQASAANLSPADSIRLRSAATTLAREADKAERQLEKRQQARPQEPVPQPAPQQPTETKPQGNPQGNPSGNAGHTSFPHKERRTPPDRRLRSEAQPDLPPGLDPIRACEKSQSRRPNRHGDSHPTHLSLIPTP